MPAVCFWEDFLTFLRCSRSCQSSFTGSDSPLAGVEVSFRDVSFCYPGTQHFVLKGFNLAVPAGSIAAIVGPNGAGKSTLLKLLCRFYDPDVGSVTLGGTDLRHFNRRPSPHDNGAVPAAGPLQRDCEENIAFGALNLQSDDLDQQ